MNQMTDDNLDNQNDYDQFDNFDVNADDQSYGDDFSEAEKPKKSRTLAIVIFLLVIAGIGGAGYKFYFGPLLNAQQAQQGDGVPPGGAIATDSTLPPSVTADPAQNAESMTPPPPPVVDANAAPTAAPGEDGTVPDNIDVAQLPSNTLAPAAEAVATPDTTTPAPETAAPDAVINSALPAPTATPPAAPAADAATIEAPSRVATPDSNETITPSLPVSTANNSLAPVASESAATPAPVATTETVKTPVADEPVPAAPTEIAATASTPENPAVVDTAASDKISALEQKVEALPSADAIAKLTSQLEALTQRLDALDKRTETLATELQNKEANASAAPAVEPTPVVKEEPTPAPAPVKKPAPKKAAAKPKPVASTSWTLRSAQPGAAWLSKPGSEEMVRYAVGQVLPGSGTITTVNQENGRWVVKTDRGITINQ